MIYVRDKSDQVCEKSDCDIQELTTFWYLHKDLINY